MSNQSFRGFSPHLINYAHYLKSSLILIVLVILLTGPIIIAAPVVYLTETINAEFDYNGTLINQENRGFVEVELFNTEDVLQNIIITLRNTTKTNLTSNETYAAVAASPSAGDKTRIYMDTDEGNGTIYYNFTDDTIVNISINYWNEVGGKDLTPENNTIYFEVFLNASENLNNIKFNLNVNRDTLITSDSMNILAVDADSGIVSLINSDFDGFNDIIQWTGDLNTNTRINFTSTIIPDVNYPRNQLRVDIDSHESSLNYSQLETTFTGTYIFDRFAKGPVRQGLRIMAEETNWTIMGFIKNIASGINYTVHNSNIYKILDNGSLENTSVLSNSTEEILYPGNLTTTHLNCNDDYTQCTGIYDTGIVVNTIEKPTAPNIYYAPSFNWSINWDSSNRSRIIKVSVNLPTFYQMEVELDKRINLIYNDETGSLLSIEEEIKHLGHAILQLENISINITGLAGWNNSTLEIFYVNNTNETKITDYTSSRIGDTIFINISSMTSEKIQVNEFILIKYNLSRGPENLNVNYPFGLNTIITTKSGTPVEKSLTDSINIPGIGEEGDEDEDGNGGSGGDMPETKDFIDILKIESTSKFITNSLIKNDISFKILDTGTKGIRDPIFFIYMPEKSNIYSDQVEVFLLRNNKKEKLNVEIKKIYNKTIGGKSYTEYTVQKITGSTETFILYDQDIITISYRAYIPLGTSEIITRLYGHNYYDDIYMFEDAITKMRREYWKLQNLEIKQSGFETNKIFVGKPVEWIKTIEIYNPNEMAVKEMYTSNILSDRLNSKVKESKEGNTYDIPIENEEKDSLDFLIDIKGKERVIYFIFATTSPILETKREINILEITNASVKLNLKIMIKNLGKYDYEESYLRLPIQNILDCNLNYSYVNGQTEIEILNMSSFEEKTIELTYEEKPPVLKIYLDKSEYNNEENMNLTIIVVQADKKGYIELEITGPENNRNTVYADLIHLDTTNEKINIELPLNEYLKGDYILSAYYKSDFQQILIEKLEISVSGGEYKEIPWILFFILTFLIAGFVYNKRYKKKTLKEKLSELKSKL